MDFPQMGAGSPADMAGGGDPSGGAGIDPAVIQALIMALLGQGGGGQQDIIQMLSQIDPRALQSLIFGGALDAGSMPGAEDAAIPPGSF